MFRKIFVLPLFAISILIADRSDASILILNIGGGEYSSSGASAIATDAVVLTLNDSIVAGAVQMEVWFKGGTGVNPLAILNDLTMNLDPTKSITSFGWVSGVVVNTVGFSPNGYNNDGSHGYDIEFNYPPPTGAPRLTVNGKSTYNMFGSGLTVSSFLFTNQSGHGPFRAAVHINEVNVGKSGHYADSDFSFGGAVPEPTTFTVWFAICGLVALVGYRNKIA